MSKQSDTALVDGVIRAAAHLEPELEEALAEHGLTRPSYLVLLALRAAEGEQLSQRGRERVEAARPAYEETAGRLAAGLPDDDRAAFAERLQRWLGFFEGDERVAPRLGVAVAPAAVAQRMRRAVGLPDRHGVLVVRVKRGGGGPPGGPDRGG